ncbi:Proteasome subunit alpha type-1 [Nosema bombycis CQ1]|uniref:Proteasome subunit alpha type-1 n=2 Tax=Nosema bombycis (strain CQ1 / CVCC 102059) TaxID=578461 RepID=R0MAP2_NOSB1|nr:Proteasome subunit alpha type-1 [Nosema bombycis CQ1]|eukprot:EOB15034.1 Proteasome subunit alpha type-1 [Nosema bombycis CQ1]
MSFVTDYNNHIIFNPEGKIKQMEFISNTTTLGNTVVALSSGKSGVYITYNEKISKLADHQKKIFKINNETLFSFAGVTNDGLNLVDYLIDRSVHEKVIKERKIHPIHVFDDFLEEVVSRTVSNRSRLFAIDGLLMTIHDSVKLVLFEHAGTVREVRGMSIGRRCQSCRTVLETECLNFNEMNHEELIAVGIKALKNAYPETGLLKGDNVDIWILDQNEGIHHINSATYID